MNNRKGRENDSSGNYGSSGIYPGDSYYRRKRRKDRERRKRLLVGAAAGLMIVSLSVIGVKKFLRAELGATGTETVPQEEASSETALNEAVTINDIDITGMSRQDAKKAVMKRYVWNMTARLRDADGEDQVYELSDLLELRLEQILDEIYGGGRQPRESYAIDAEGLDEALAAEAAAMAEQWDRAPKNGAISGYDKETKRFTYSDSVDGRIVDQAAAVQEIRTAMREKNYGAVLSIGAETLPAELSAEEAKERYKVIGTFTTKATSNTDRNNNLKLACEAIDGKILQVGEEFSFNQTTGNRTIAKGYKPAGAYLDGKVVLEPGGGVCQISSTLYNAIIKAGLTPTERHAHTFEPSYVTPGEDAAVSYDGYSGPDMRFVNTTDSAVALRASFQDRTVTISVVGLPVLDEDVTISLHSVRTEEYDNGGIEYVEDTTIEPGVEKQLAEGSMGSRWVTNIVTKKGSEVISDVFFHNSTYKGHSRKIARNTSGIVTLPDGSDAMTIVENTETAAEQANNSATEAGSVAPAGPGEAAARSSSSAAQTGAVGPSQVGPGTKPGATGGTAAAESSTAERGPGTELPTETAGEEELIAPFPGA